MLFMEANKRALSLLKLVIEPKQMSHSLAQPPQSSFLFRVNNCMPFTATCREELTGGRVDLVRVVPSGEGLPRPLRIDCQPPLMISDR